jgi:hypothetical protein
MQYQEGEYFALVKGKHKYYTEREGKQFIYRPLSPFHPSSTLHH